MHRSLRKNLILKSGFIFQVALHACGVATDMVIEHCIKTRASFVTCPCCYGFIQNTSKFNFPKRWNLVFYLRHWCEDKPACQPCLIGSCNEISYPGYWFSTWQVLFINCIRKKGSPLCLSLIFLMDPGLLKFRSKSI